MVKAIFLKFQNASFSRLFVINPSSTSRSNCVISAYLVGAGDAAPDAVLEETPFVWVVVVVVVPLALVLVDPTESRDGRGVVVLGILLVGMRDGVASSVLSSDSVDPCRDGGFEPARLAGRELGRELARDPPGVI